MQFNQREPHFSGGPELAIVATIEFLRMKSKTCVNSLAIVLCAIAHAVQILGGIIIVWAQVAPLKTKTRREKEIERET